MKKNAINMKELKARYAKLYPNKKLFFTSDGNCFLQESPAKDHARKAGVEFSTLENGKASVEEDLGDLLKAAKEQLSKVNLEEIDYRDAYDLATDLSLPLKDKKKATVMAALESAKAELSKLSK